jgi:membrane protein DedA with SNARE-associated domain/rhodanese-related sulfurtransferase
VNVVEFLIRHGYAVLFASVLAEAAGLPLPAAPVLISAGALVGTGRMYLPLTLALPVLAVTLCDTLWYLLGRHYGGGVLRLVCRISLEPDSCVRRTQISFEKRGTWALMTAKFIPGLSIMTSPLAGVSRMSWRRFVVFDATGALLWIGVYVTTGFVFSAELERVLDSLSFFGAGLVGLVLAALGGYIFWKWLSRQRAINKLRVERITPEELKTRLEAGEDVVVVDLRHPIEIDAERQTISGAIQMDPADLDEAIDVIPRDREIVLFCSCPNEATAAKMALRLQTRGVTRIRPLAEGIEGWRRRGFPMQGIEPTSTNGSTETRGLDRIA